jgi:serine/threonine protein kinase/tetratricopeptide (TPR) repeat protein
MTETPIVCLNCGADIPAGEEECFNCGRHLTKLTKGSVIASRYEILSLLGKGGMGIVYQAQDRLLDEVVAIKVLRSEFVQDPAMAQRFRSEIKLARKVSHPNVCRIHEYGEDGSISYISMALIEGTDLRRVLQQSPEGLPTKSAFRLALEVTEGLQAIHAVGIIHRDLKSPNIICDTAGSARLMDFGIAKESGMSGGLTAVGEVMGTPEYMSPEQCRGNPLDFRSDIYSLGIVIYEIFTGRVPFRGDSVMATLLKQVEDPPPLDGPAASRIPAGVAAVLRKALAKNAADRYATAAAMADALREAQRQPHQPQPPQPVVEESEPTRVLEPVGERRRDTRLPISLDLMLRRLGAGGSVLQEERTVTDNIGAHGARVLTTMTDLSEGHTVSVQEVGGSFGTKSIIRHVSTGTDRVRRLGIEFVDRAAPDHLVPTHALTKPSGATKGVASKHDERRKDSRLGISIDVILRRLSPGGAVLHEERTVVDNIGRRGARVLTTMTDLGVGDVVSIQEVGSEFKTRATVRSAITGADNIRRVGLEFLDRTAPDHLVPAGETMVRTPRPPPQAAPHKKAPMPTGPSKPHASLRTSEETATLRQEILAAHAELKTRTHFEVLGLPRASGAAQVKDAYFQLFRRFHPDLRLDPKLADLAREIEAISARVDEAYEVLIDPASRSRYENMLGPSRRTPPSVQRASTPASVPAAPASRKLEPPPPERLSVPRPETGSMPVASVEADVDTPTRLAEQLLQDARKLLAKEAYWDAIQKLERAVDLAQGTKVNQSIRILLAQTTGRNPKWLKQAEAALLGIVQEDPRRIDAYVALGGVYKAAGLKSRALNQLRKALELEPGHKRAQAEMDGLSDP